MNKTAIMTDTNSGITPEVAKENGIYLLRMPFTVDGEDFSEYGSLGYDEFFAHLGAGAEVFTSQPSPAVLTEIWNEILNEYTEIVYIPMSSELSGTYSTSYALSSEYDGKVRVINNRRISVTLYASVMDAVKMSKKGMSAEEIANRLEDKGSEQSIYVAVNTLDNLKKSGRVTSAGAAIGTLLGIKPVLQIQGGKLDAYKKVRGMRAAGEAMLDGIEFDLKTRFKDKKVEISAAYSGHRENGEEWRNTVAKRFPEHTIRLDALPISISCHVGAGALGIGITPIEE